MFHSSPSSSSSHLCVGDSSPPVSCPAFYPTAAASHGFLDANPSAVSHLLSSSPSFSYSSSLPNCFLPRSSSSHSLPFYHRRSNPLAHSSFFSPPLNPFLHLQQQHPPPPPPAFVSSSPPSSSSGEFLEFSAGPMRRVFSAGDIQGSYGTPATGENHVRNQEGGAISSKIAKYSSEERKERVERYRSKRNQRNFHKKITYACRKTLADSRPRVRGRFARNGEAETGAEAAENLHEFYALNNFEPAHGVVGELADGNEHWFRHTQAASEEGEDDIWATICDVLSMNLLS